MSRLPTAAAPPGAAFFAFFFSVVVLAQSPTAEICSLSDPVRCSCGTLATAVAKLDSKNISLGEEIGGVVWTPLFTAYFHNCQDVGRALVKRGADVNAGGREGALLAEVATQRTMNADPKSNSTNIAWAGILEGGPIDLDAPQSRGASNRQVWRGPLDASRQRYAAIWSRFEHRSVPTPLPPDSDAFDPDIPTSASGVTRPAESPVSKGVEKFAKIYPKSGMAGVSTEISGCYRWALKIAKPAARRVALEHCAGLDLVARDVDLSFTSKMNFPPSEFFEPARFESRINQIREQNFDGLVWPIYRRNLESSARQWAYFHAELVTSREASNSTPTSQPNAQLLLSQWYDLNGLCRGGSGNEARTNEACERREKVGRQLSQLGFCYGRRGEYGYQATWHHPCGPDSIR